MTCEQAQRLLSMEPAGTTALPHSIALRRHLDGCPDCRRFLRALLAVDEALEARPLAEPPPGLLATVMVGAHQRPRRAEVSQPLSRAFWMMSAMLTLVGLVAGAVLLHSVSSTAPTAMDPRMVDLWLSPTWPSDASTWLSLQSDHVAEVILAIMAGIVIAVTGVALGFRASQRQADDLVARREHTTRLR